MIEPQKAKQQQSGTLYLVVSCSVRLVSALHCCTYKIDHQVLSIVFLFILDIIQVKSFLYITRVSPISKTCLMLHILSAHSAQNVTSNQMTKIYQLNLLIDLCFELFSFINFILINKVHQQLFFRIRISISQLCKIYRQ